ncbi:helix-turn-helix transcriptional regulator [Kocuria flava]|uniref:helix-turn-helix transcriptional regulator n=1 Tax=Kocuria flava TaxID=446860 RepID=UPI003F1AEB97
MEAQHTDRPHGRVGFGAAGSGPADRAAGAAGDAPSPGANRWRFATDDVEAGLEALERVYAVRRLSLDGDVPFSMLLGVRRIERISMERVRLPGVVAESEADGAGVLRLALLLGGRLAVRQDRHELAGTVPALLPLHHYTPEWQDLDLLTATLDLAAVQEHAAGLLGMDHVALRFTSPRPVSPELGEYLARAVLSAARDELTNDAAMAHPLVRDELFRRLATATLHTFPGSFLDHRSGPGEDRPLPAAVRRAVSFMEDHLAEPIGLGEIAAAARLSPRGLQAAFRRALNTTPLGHLRALRLAAAHTELLSADPATSTVAVIAARWGFAHPGRFAAAYRQRYGQAPAQSLYS